ncbi:peptidase M28 [Dissoconium aciculare CBS 342.82]|uniref:Peptide hydrolase n=1 Tax=Dissoconium aciculare CBS 342.82 TaxID=1314786 RepID=A0A6J3MIK5_9PEZI|nr:peptidase M28 [Dissoconium aciculare CBS 342.82]KAF1827756.1 peptidase M28 [Dissoconium aciculare CBS 342.82]
MATRSNSWNPIAFLPAQVSLIGGSIYAVLITALLFTHLTIPSVPSSVSISSVNITEAWHDLGVIATGYHPWGSRRNDAVREYLLERVGQILERNGADYKTVFASDKNRLTSGISSPKLVTVFANDTSNFTSRDDWSFRPLTLYGESANIIVYIRGKDDEKDDWWNTTTKYRGSSGVLVNAHFDSVPSAVGATDDGVGVVTILQLISHYTSKGNRPKRGIIALLNNGEENGLYGARNYMQHPIAQLPHTFLNLEGAGAGGRATLFRSTDAEVTRAYSKSPYPFGSVISGDGFKRNFIRSGTDYTIFTQDLGMRGLDVAFFAPRARYHTDEDDARDTSRNSLWHMLSASLATMDELTSYAGDEFEGTTDRSGKFKLSTGSDAIWFDLFGRAFAVMRMATLFGLSVALLTAGPVVFIFLHVLIQRSGKWYPFSTRKYLRSSDDDESAQLHGVRGFFRFPIAVVVASAAVVGLAYLLTKLNPYILYGHQYTVWAMMLSIWFFVAWFILAGASNVRPTALQRMYALIWLYILSWIGLVFATVGENNLHLGSGYFLVIYNASVWTALFISYLELFALPKKSKYVEHVLGAQSDAVSTRPGSISSRRILSSSDDGRHDVIDGDDITETTSLLRGRTANSNKTFPSFSRRRRADRDEVPDDTEDPYLNRAYMNEQAWSSSLPQWTWIIQFLILAPINVILVGQIGLLLTSALSQTSADGNGVLVVYLFLAALTVLLLLPLTPFLHRFSFHIPLALLLVFAGCLTFSLVSFPFSREARMKFYFIQQVNLDEGSNNVTIRGLNGYIQDVIAELPSSSDQALSCHAWDPKTSSNINICNFEGILPQLVPHNYSTITTSKSELKSWLKYNISHKDNHATITLQGLNTKICQLVFNNAVSEVRIEGSGSDPRMRPVADGGSSQVHLFSRTWDKTFKVDVAWPDAPAKGQRGRVVCSWSDGNTPGVIPAFDEIRKFQPVWSIVTKASHGLVEGYKEFEI